MDDVDQTHSIEKQAEYGKLRLKRKSQVVGHQVAKWPWASSDKEYFFEKHQIQCKQHLEIKDDSERNVYGLKPPILFS